MRRYLLLVLLLACVSAHAANSLRVDSKVLMVGDTAVRVMQLMGEPTARALVSGANGGMPNNQLGPGEEWQYAQGDKTIIVTLVGGRVTNFETRYE